MSDNTNASEYNGWKNYPTWAVNMWLSNDEGLYRYVSDMAREEVAKEESASPYWTKAQSDLYCLADSIKCFVTDTQDEGGISPDLGASFASDLLGYALDCVDWDEIASAWLSGVEA